MKVWAMAVTAAAMLLAGCTAVVPAGPSVSLKNTSWVVTEIQGTPTITDLRPSMEFGAAGEVGGNGSCNPYSGTYTLNGTQLGFADLSMTAMACLEGGAMEQETAFHSALSTVVTARFTGDTVELLDGDGEVALLLAPVPPLELAGTSWVLAGLIDGNVTSAPVEGDPVSLSFESDQLSGKACNTVRGEYTLEGDQIKVGPLMSTKMACLSEELSAQENLVFEVLQNATTVTANHRLLQLTAPDGRGLQFDKA